MIPQNSKQSNLNRELAERVKELNCLYQLSHLTGNTEMELDEFFTELIKIIQQAWQFEDVTAVKINYDSETYISDNFKETSYFHSSDIYVNNKKSGKISVFYIEEKPSEFNGPFLKEEIHLLKTIASDVSHYLERKEYLHDKFIMQKYLNITFQSIGDAVIATDIQERVSLMNKVAEKLTGWSLEDAKGEKLEDVFRIENSITGEKAENPVRKVLETGNIVGLANHTKLISKSGEEYQIADSGSPITDENNEIHGVVLVFRDVTKEYQLNEDLASKTKHLEKAQKIGKIGSWKFDLKTAKVKVSNESKRIYGLHNDKDLHIEDIQKIPLEKYRAYLDKSLENLIKGIDVYEVEFEIKRLNDGKIIDVYSIAEYDKEKNVVEGVIRDISAQKSAENKADHWEELFRYVIEHSNGAVAVHDTDLNYLYVSQRYIDDYNIEDDDIIGKHHYEVFPDLPQKWRDVHQRALNGEVISEERDEFIRSSGESIWTRWECRPWFLTDGSIGGIIVFTEVITDRVNNEINLKRREENLRLLIENQTDLIVKVDADYKFTFVSKSYCETFGKTEAELLGTKFTPLVHEDDLLKTQQKMTNLAKFPYKVYLEQRAKTINGWRWLAWNDKAVVDENGNIVEIIGVGRDITEKKQFEFELLETERQLSSMINNLPGAVYKCKFDKDWTMIYLSDNIKQINGYDAQSFINNKELTFNDIIHPDYRDLVYEKWEEAVENKSQFELEYKMLTKDNKEIWVLERGIAVYEKDNVMFLEGYIEDVNDKKISQDEVLELKNNLEIRVKEMTAELQNRVDDLERFHEATIEREFRIKELRDEVESLKKSLDENSD